MSPQIVSIIVTVAVMALVLLLRNRKPRPLKLERLWVRPLLAVVFVALALHQQPPEPTAGNIALLVVAAVIGGALGWQRGRFMQIEVDPATLAASVRMSAVGAVFVLALAMVRIALRNNAPQAGPLSATMITDALLVLTGLMMIVQQVEVTLRARRLIAAARATAPA